jgi:oligosaccharyltransferase complex subunit beta
MKNVSDGSTPVHTFFNPRLVEFAPDITLKSLIDVLSGGTNLLITLTPAQSPINSLAVEFSLILPPPSTPLISHFPERKTKPNVIPINVPPSHPVLSPNISPVWFSGVPHAFGLNPFTVPILNAPTESFATDNAQDSDADALNDAAEKGGEGLWAGKSLGVVSGFQTRENTRVLWLGGYEMVTDKYMNMDLPECV